MMAEIDPRLLEQLNQAGDQGEVEALMLLGDHAQKAAASEAERGGASGVIGACLGQLSEQPTLARYLPRLGALYVKGSAKLIRQLLASDQITSASANEGELSTG